MIANSHSAPSVGNHDECSICFEPLATKRIITLHPCMHRFHHTCIVRWLESAENFVTAEPRCSHCRTVADRRIDERGRRVPLVFPMEEKGEELNINEIVLTDMVDLWTKISGIIDSLNDDKKRAEQIGKSKEFIADIDQEMDKLRHRQDATELLFVTIVINKDVLIKSLQDEVADRKTAFDKEIVHGIRTRAAAKRRRVVEKELAQAKKEFEDEVNATSKDVQKAFKKHCAAKLAAVAADATAALPGPSTTEPAKRRMRVEDNSEEGPQMKRRRRN
ncbi:hypothetical protein PRIPAC_91584 [Pristionchus pacificus]|uniref:Zinc finger protein n=1 Tax=Pristionchus pacificus TaxID=54126 RepID=A0A2A6BAM8_PRIPA|nr:hypothetical protein PRIPAC_91584 [Pristionchus pacificus]|eukprot:PDM62945.1 zinc finger protein [Pristionchus pacificus]